jgi:parallel beta-helix repeat protein
MRWWRCLSRGLLIWGRVKVFHCAARCKIAIPTETMIARSALGFSMGIAYAVFWLSSPVQAQVESMPECAPGTIPSPAQTTSAAAQTSGPLSLSIAGQIGGSIRAVAVQGSYVYAGVGQELVVIDASNPSAMREMGASATLKGAPQGIAIDGQYAYVAAGEGGLYVIDISNPAQPVVRGNYTAAGYAEGVAFSSEPRLITPDRPRAAIGRPLAPPMLPRYAYMAYGSGGLRIIDVTDPANPFEVASAFTMDYVLGVAVADGHAYLAAAGAGLLIADISRPNSPQQMASLGTPGYAYGVAAGVRGTVYIADGWAGVRIVDVTNPVRPNEVGASSTQGWAMSVQAAGATLYVADALAGLRIMDISSRTQPMDVGGVVFSGNGHAQRVAVSGNLAFVADRKLGLQAVDVSSPASPALMGTYQPMGYVNGVAVAGGYAYAGAGVGLRALDVSQPGDPQITGSLNYSSVDPAGRTQATSFGSVSVSGHFVVSTAQLSTSVYFTDVSSPAQPKGYAFQFPFGTTRNQVIEGGLMIMANEWGLRLINISNPLSPCELSFMNFTGAGPNPAGNFPLGAPVATGVAVSGNIAYAAVGAGGVWIIDVSQPGSPVKVGEYHDPAGLEPMFPVDLAVDGNFLYVAGNSIPGGRGVLRALDITNPRQPVADGSFDLPGQIGFSGSRIAVAGGTVFVADGPPGVITVDASNPSKLQLAGQLSLAGSAENLAVNGSDLYVAADEGGLFVVQTVPGSSAAVSALGMTRRAGVVPAMALRSAIPRAVEPFPRIDSEGQRSSGGTCVVQSSGDGGSGTLRQCLEQTKAGDTITFDPITFPPGAPATIRLVTALPQLQAGHVTIDASNAGVVLDGSQTPSGSDGLVIASNGNLIEGLEIKGFNGNGIRIAVGANNVIGGDRSQGAGPFGRGNVLSGNGQSGVLVGPVAGTLVLGNYIGIDASGMQALANGVEGVTLEGSTGSTVGGALRADRNVISANAHSDVHLVGAGLNQVVGNYIGTDAAGKVSLSNTGYFSVAIDGSSPTNLVQGNVITGGMNGGIMMVDAGTSYNQILGNYVGFDATGTVAIGATIGINSVNQPFNRIGGLAPQERNLIAGSIFLGAGASDSVVMGNVAGGLGVNSSHNFVGGSGQSEGNTLTNIGISGGAADNFIAGNSAASGIQLNGAVHNTLQSNQVSGPGITAGSSSDFNWLRFNRITSTLPFGIEITASAGNRIDHNAFLNNTRAEDNGQNNRWDDGGHGNFWTSYTGQDADGDGIGDTPYTVPPNGLDHFPLMADPTKAKQ